MKPALLSLLACPRCGGEMAWTPVGGGSPTDWEQDGLLTCPGSHRFPVIGGVPRFLEGPLFGALRRRYPRYFAGLDADGWTDDGLDADGPAHAILLETVERFGYEWTRYADYDAQNLGRFLEPIGAELRPGMRLLDAGCGAGRHLLPLAAAGMEVVGVDVSWAVESAGRRAVSHPRIHVVQADLLRLPLRRGLFDVVMSLGVLHHLPDPARGVAAIVEQIRPGGRLLAWVYMRTPRKVILEPLRRVVRHLPSRGIDALSLLCASLEYALLIGPYRWVCRARGRPVLQGLLPQRIQEYAALGFRVSRVDWYDRLAAPVSQPMTRAQAQALLALPGLRDQHVAPIDDSWWRCSARVLPPGGREAA